MIRHNVLLETLLITMPFRHYSRGVTFLLVSAYPGQPYKQLLIAVVTGAIPSRVLQLRASHSHSSAPPVLLA
jgi:hypothetical protein